MQILKSIEIARFRSIYKASIKTPDITVLSGRNNSGKSNVLKALNLFFKGEPVPGIPYSHDTDFNIAYTGGAGGRREITITLNFYGHGEGKLKDDFSITKTFWNGTTSEPKYVSSNPVINEAIENHDGTVIREFTRFYNKLDYIYVPAIRDRDFVSRLFGMFERVIDGESATTFNAALTTLNDILRTKSQTISSDFEAMLNLKARARLSSRPSDILEAIGIDIDSGMTVTQKSGVKQPVSIDLFSNGDGILMSYIPHFLAYITTHQKNRKFIWGFEEPENSLEYSKVQQLASKFVSDFTADAQILLTTHSPAFINLEKQASVSLYRVYSTKSELRGSTQVATTEQLQQKLQFEGAEGDARDTLLAEIGMTELALEIEAKVQSIQLQDEELRDQLATLTKPVIYSEGHNLTYLLKAKEFFDPNGDYDILDGGGKNQLKSFYDFMLKNPPRHKVIIAWDPDCTNFANLASTQTIFPIVLSALDTNRMITTGIEACLPEEPLLDDRNRFYQTELLPHGGEKTIPRKPEIMLFFCQERPSRETFRGFQNFFERAILFLNE